MENTRIIVIIYYLIVNLFIICTYKLHTIYSAFEHRKNTYKSKNLIPNQPKLMNNTKKLLKDKLII